MADSTPGRYIVRNMEIAVQHRRMAHERWQRVFLLFCLCGLLLLAVAWLAVGVGGELPRNLQQARDLETASNEVRRLQQTLADLETGQRGYLLTSDAAYLQPYHAAASALPALLASLLQGASGDAQSLQLLDQIRHLAAAKASELEQVLALQREQGRDVALTFMQTGVGMSLMDQFRTHTEALIALKQNRLAELRAAIPVLVKQRDTTLLVIVALGLISGLAAFWSMRRHLILLRREVNLRETASRAVRESSEKSLFLANLSHEIRTPMNAIFGFTQLLEELVHGERPRFYVQAIQSSGKALLDLINDILDISKIEAGKLEVRPAPTDLRELMTMLNTVFAQMAMEKGLKLVITVDERLPRALLLDPSRLRQVMFNLVGNAIRYTDSGKVEVRIAVEDALEAEGRVCCRIEVQDSGIGINAADRERIFEPFIQLEHGAEARRGGTGLGLAIVSRLVGLMDGRIAVESAPGSGSIFRLEFPQVRVGEEVPVVMPPSGRLEDLPPLTIVAVDDIALNRELLNHLFAQTPHRLLLADGGAAGVELTQRERPDLVLMDIRMPEVDGREALRRIRADPALADVVVVAVTASSLLDEETTLRSTFDGYVRKPMTRQTLHAELARLFAPLKATEAAAENAAVAEPTPASSALSALSAAAREALLCQLRELKRLVEVASATQASSDVASCVTCAAGVDQWLGDRRFVDLAQRVESAAALFDLTNLSARLSALEQAATELRESLMETAT